MEVKINFDNTEISKVRNCEKPLRALKFLNFFLDKDKKISYNAPE
jgi:hypothetical protein